MAFDVNIKTQSVLDTENVGEALAKTLLEEPELPRFVALFGDLGVGKTALSMIETGRSRLSTRNKNILVQELNANPEWLERGVGEMFNAEPGL
jgi:hypothetical protein